MQLIIGAGSRHKEGYIHHDVKPLDGIDIVCDFWDLKNKLEASSFDKIEATHFLEHFPRKDTPLLLADIKYLLKPGGELYLEVPNFAWHGELVAQGRSEDAEYYAFGGQLDEWDFHKTGFTPTILTNRLTEAGFVDIDIDGWDSLRVTCKNDT